MMSKFICALSQMYYNAKICNKITLFNSLLFGGLALVLLIFNNAMARHLAINNALKNAKQSNLIVQEKINYLLSNSSDMAALIDNNDIIQKSLLAKTNKERMDRIYPMTNILNRTVQNSTGISTIVLYPMDWSTPITSTRVNLDKLEREPSERLIRDMTACWDKISWSDTHICDYQIFHNDRTTVTLKRNVISIYTGKIVGILIIDITENRISQAYKGELDDDSAIMIVNKSGDIVSAADKRLLLKNIGTLSEDSISYDAPFISLRQLKEFSREGSQIFSFQNERYLVNVALIEELEWYIVRAVPLHSVYLQTRGITVVSCLVALIASFLAALCVRKIATGLTRPLMQLSRIMEEPIECADTLSIPGNDEVSRLNKSFQRMRLNIQILIERIKYEQNQQMRINMASLQTQINPHFLYNTLDSVCALLQIGRIDDASHMLKSIELFYRGTLSKGNTIISIRDEIFVTEQFIHIQQYRYDGNLNVDFIISDEIMSCRIPKLTLQPIVENAIYHGLKNGGRDGSIQIYERHDAKEITISITDNGVGFEPASLEAPKYDINSGGFGLFNTQRRIKHFFGEEYGIRIESCIGRGTTVSLRIPNRKMDESEGGSI